MKFLFICDYLHPQYGYQEFHLAYALAKKLKRDEINLITTDRYYPFNSYENHFKVLGERIHGKQFEKFENLKVFYYKPLLEIKSRVIPSLNFFKLIFNKKFDICFSHSSSSFTSLLLLIFSRFLPFNLVVDSHMHFVAHKKTKTTKIYYFFLRLINKYLVSKKVIYFGVTEESCEFLRIKESARENQIKLLPIGFSYEVFKVPKILKNFYAIRKNIRKYLGIKDEDILIMQTGKLSTDKRPDLTIQASSFNLKRKKGHILFLGPHSQNEKIALKKLFNEIKKDNWELRFLKNVEFSKLRDYFLACDFLSYPGGATLSCIEGAASGCKSIVSYTPEGKSRAKLGISEIPDNDTDKSFIECLHKVIYKIESEFKEIKQIHKESLFISNIVKEFSYKRVSDILIKDIGSIYKKK